MKALILGSLLCTREQLPGIVDALNYLRDGGTKISCSKVKRTDGDKVVVPLMYKGMTEALTGQVATILDCGQITWSDNLLPRASEPSSIILARAISAGVERKGAISVDSILPDDKKDAFEGLIGLERQKRLISRVADAIAAYGRDALECTNACFLGGPGTGKTEMAERFAKYCGLRGITKTDKIVKVSAADLISNHVGETPKLVREAFDRADGGMLFVDEAYSLTQGDCNDYGKEAVNALVEAMDRLRARVMVVVAGYEDEMSEFLRSNPGLESRFEFSVRFEGYTDEELAKIFCHFSTTKQFLVSDEVRVRLPETMGMVRRSVEDFASARTVRKLFDSSVIAAAQNHPDLRTIECVDLEEAVSEVEAKPRCRRVGFA